MTLMSSPARHVAINDLVVANRVLAHRRVLDAFGHVSVRDPDDSGRFLMARSRAPALVTREDIVTFTLDCAPLDDAGRPLYAERPIHGEIYKARPDVNAICHNHAHSLIPFGVTSEPLRPVFHIAAVIGEVVPVWDIADDFGDTDLLVTDADKGAALAVALGAEHAVLMRGHGSAVVGADIRQSVFRAVYLMVNAELLATAKALGGPLRMLSKGEIAAANATLSQPLSQERAWQEWSAEAGFEGIA